MRVDTLSKKARSWVMTTTLPLNSTNKSSSHWMLSKSKWLVGSSNSSMSGKVTRAWPNATRFLVPPDKLPTKASASKCRRCRVSVTRCSQFQPSCISILFCRALRSPSPA